MMQRQLLCWALAFCLLTTPASADDLSDWVAHQVDSQAASHSDLALQLWSWAEVGYQETKSSAALQARLREAGFDIQAPVAGLPTAFIATYGQGSPVIGLLAEFDALPGLSQDSKPVRAPLQQGAAGHACGHHLFGTGSVAAAITAAQWLKKSGGKGTIKLFGTPAEEGGSGKVYMVREGVFDGVDSVLHWHSSDRNAAANATSLANKSAKFRFYGKSAHAAVAPEQGRSALDGVEAMNYMANMLREHVPSDTRIHYVITHGGEAPNVVPEYAEVYYYLRSPRVHTLAPIWERLEKAARGAAQGTGTELKIEVMHGNFSLLPNTRLTSVLHKHLSYYGGVEYSADDIRFAEQIQKTYSGREQQYPSLLEQAASVMPYTDEIFPMPGSTDVGDVSWNVPTAGIYTATWVPGTGAHSWQAVAAGGTPIGTKGMLLAAKVLARTILELIASPSVNVDAREELIDRRGENFDYTPLLGDRLPPLDYRNKSTRTQTN